MLPWRTQLCCCASQPRTITVELIAPLSPTESSSFRTIGPRDESGVTLPTSSREIIRTEDELDVQSSVWPATAQANRVPTPCL